MKSIFTISVLTFLLVAASSQCFAEMTIEQVSKERAKELGMEIRTKASGTNAVWVELEFKPEGKFKDFSHVSLEIGEGKRLLVGYAALREKRSSSGSVVVNFMANRAFLDKITLTVAVADVPLGGSGYELRVKDFVELVQERNEHPDDISQQLFETYIVRDRMANTSTRMAAAHIVAERGRDSGFWRTILKELQKGDEGSEMGCVQVLGKMLAVDARARDVIRREKETGQIGQWRAAVCLGPEVVQELIRRGQKTERFRVDAYATALARARVPEATQFWVFWQASG